MNRKIVRVLGKRGRITIPECFDEENSIPIEDFIDSLTPEQQRRATIYLNLLWAQKEGASVGRT